MNIKNKLLSQCLKSRITFLPILTVLFVKAEPYLAIIQSPLNIAFKIKTKFSNFFDQGSLRFSSPVPKKSWDSVLEANHLPNACMQARNEFFGNFSGSQPWNPNTPISEDCLYLNVFAPVSIKEVIFAILD